MSAPSLRPYQVHAVDSARDVLRQGKRSVLLVCPTGGGKTVIGAEIIRGAVGKGRRSLFLAHRRELIHQTAAKLRDVDVRYGIIMAGERMSLAERCQVASIQTLANRRDAVGDVDLIFFDEAHHAMADSYRQVLEWFPKARVVGLTATPWRQDGRGLGDVFEETVVVARPGELRDGGYLCPVGGWEYEPLDVGEAKVRGGDYVVSSLAAAAASKRVMGDVVGEYLKHAQGKRAIAFCVNVDHSSRMALAFQDAGVAAEHLDGTTPREERDAILARLRSGQTQVVTNCAVLTEGFDCPELEVCILARPTLSEGLYLQMVGRVLRPAPGKESARIHDHARCLALHGHPFADRDYLAGETTLEQRKGEASGSDRTVKRCPACDSVRTRWPCDACGHRPSEEQLQAEAELAVRAKAIEAEAEAKSEKQVREREMAAKFKSKSDEERRDFFFRMVAKHGVRKAIGVYRWWSGETSWPTREWKEVAGFYATVPQVAQ